VREGWEVKTLGELAKIQLGKTPHRKSEKFWDKEKSTKNIWLSIADMKHGEYISDSKEYLSDLGAENGNLVPEGTLMISFKLTLGRVSFAGCDLLTNEAIASLLDLKDNISKKYLFYYFSFFDWFKETEGDQKVKGRTLNKKKLALLPIIVPPLKEQTQIVKTLDLAFKQIDQAKANLEKNLANAKELFASKLNEVFSQRGEGWEEKKLGEITTKIGSGSTPRGGQASYKESGISLIRSMNVHDDGFREKKLAFIDEEQALKLKNVTIEEDDVLVNITGASVARCCIVPKEYLPARVNQHVSIIRLKENILHASYLHYCLTAQENKNKLLNIGRQGATREAITKVQIENFMISYPQDMDIQLKILEELDGIKIKSELLQTHYQQKLNNLEELKKSILQKAFSGA